MKILVPAVSAAVVCLAGACAAAAAAPPVPAAWKGLVNTFDTTLKDYQIVGGSLGWIEDGRMIAQHNYGLADRASGTPVDNDTIFHWGSISKILTGIAIMQLRDQGKLTLDDKVTHYIPELRKVHNPFGSMDDITIRNLMDHSAGFMGATWPYKQSLPWEPFEPTTWEQLVAMMPYQEIAFRPGSQFGYSNPGIIYLGRIVEMLSGDPWEYYIQKHIFNPLGMTRSYFRTTPYHLQSHRSNNYSITRNEDGTLKSTDNGREFDPGITIPNGGWNAPLADVATFVGFLTQSARGDAALQSRYDSILKHSSLEEMWQVQIPTGEEGHGLGLIFFLRGTGTGKIVGHTGSQAGFCAFLYLNPASRRGMIAAYNSKYFTGQDARKWFSTIETEAFKVLQ